MDYYQVLFISGSGLLLLVQAVRGWRVGLARQLTGVAALILAYCAALLAARFAPPILRPLGYPDLALGLIGGVICGLIVYLAVRSIGSAFYGNQEDAPALNRIGSGAGGSFLGALAALFTIWMAAIGIRCLGTVAQAELALAASPQSAHTALKPGPMAAELARMKESLETGPLGAVLTGADPLPDHAYPIIRKITQVVSSPESMQRFASFPGAQALGRNPRIIALQRDPAIVLQAQHGNFLALLSNPKIVAAVNDPAVESQVKAFQLEKALDFALRGGGGDSWGLVGGRARGGGGDSWGLVGGRARGGGGE